MNPYNLSQHLTRLASTNGAGLVGTVTGETVAEQLASLSARLDALEGGVPLPTPTLSISSAEVHGEGSTGATLFTWTLTLDRDGSTEAYPYSWAVAGAGANPADATDFGGVLPSGGGTFAPGETSKTITVDVAGDIVVEQNEDFALLVTAAGLNTVTSTGTISNDDVVPGATPTPDGPEEGLITPYPSTERPLYVFEKKGTVFNRPSGMLSVAEGGGNGNYWVDVMKDPSAAYPDRMIAVVTTDHTVSQIGGMFMFVAGINPSDPTNWYDYGTPEAKAFLADKGPLPAANPITVGPFGDEMVQAETLCINRVGSAWVATLQVGAGHATPAPDGTGAGNQTTIRGTSPDLINWTWSPVALATTQTVNTIGDMHSGYARWGPNPFVDFVNPSTGQPWPYIMYRLIGGQAQSTCAIYGWANPVADHPVYITSLSKFGGRAAVYGSADNPLVGIPISIDPRTARVTPQGVVVLMNFRVRGAGATIAAANLYEVTMNTSGDAIIRKPVPVVVRGSGAPDSQEIGEARLRDFGDRRILFFDQASGGLKTTGMAWTSKRNPSNTFHEPLVPAIPASFVTRKYDFRALGGVPGDLTMVKSAAGVADPVFDTTGMNLTLLNGEEIWFYEKDGFNPNTTPYADVYLKGFRVTGPANGANVNAFWAPYIGFTGAKTIDAGKADMLYVSNGEGTVATLGFGVKVAGAEPLGANDSEYYWGIGYGPNSSSAPRKKNVGARWFPQDNRAVVLGEGGGNAEMEDMQTSGGTNMATVVDKSKTYYRAFGFRATNAAAPTTIRVEGLLIRGPNPNAGTGDSTAPTITSAATGTVAENLPYSTTFTANETVTFGKRSGADTAQFTLNSVTGVCTLTAKNFELPSDLDGNNVYVGNFSAYDTSGNETQFTHSVTVTDVAGESVVPVTLLKHSLLGSAANTQPYVFSGSTFGGDAPSAGLISLGAEAATRRVIFAVAGRGTTPTTSVSATVTPNSGPAIAATLIGFFKSTYDSPASTEMHVFQAAVPLGTTASVSVTTSPSSNFAREGLAAVVTNGVNPAPVDVQTTQQAKGAANGETLSVALDKVANGLAVAFVVHSSAGQTYITAAAETTSTAETDVAISNVSVNAVSTWSGIANPQTSLLMEATGSAGGVLIAMSFNPA